MRAHRITSTENAPVFRLYVVAKYSKSPMKVEGVASITQSYKPFFVRVIYGAVNIRQLPNKIAVGYH